jgi:hypothetical protein
MSLQHFGQTGMSTPPLAILLWRLMALLQRRQLAELALEGAAVQAERAGGQ